MLKRILTAAAALAVFIVVLMLPQIVFTLALAAVILFMLYECYSATKADLAMKIVGFISAGLLMTAIYRIFTAPSYAFTTVTAVIVMVVIIHMALTVAEHGKHNYKDILSNGFLTLYVVLSMSCMWILKEWLGITYMLFIFIGAWSTDTFAYFTGRFLGKHKLIPKVSPNKTVEGAIGGVIGAIICCVIYLFIVGKISAVQKEETFFAIGALIMGSIIGLISGIFSQLGDLVASAIKRDTEIKDFGWIFPGHGGFMDRFDSVMFISPFVFGILLLIGV